METLDRTFRLLDLVYHRYHHRHFVGHDPVGFLYSYPQKNDREVVALIAALLAFGRVEQIHEKVRQVLSWMGSSPRKWLEEFNGSRLEGVGFHHRFVKMEDMFTLFEGLKNLLIKWGSLESFFREAWERSGRDLLKTLYALRSAIVCNGRLRSSMFLPDPSKGSSCKRWMLFLRWMVRQDEIDPGGWHVIDPKDLVVPVDVHMGKVAHRLRFSLRKTVDWRMAIEITDSLRQFDPYDPVRYDFSLTRWSMERFPEF
ncbi:MAG: TIGR02757 family protein [Syntrophobacterales bacterium]|nr:TIGR02757 family protein [Syntrophobacterales bacterium]